MDENEESTTQSELTQPLNLIQEEPKKEEITQYIKQQIKKLETNIEANDERLQKEDEFWVKKRPEIETELKKDTELLKSFVMILHYHNKTSHSKLKPNPKYKKKPISLALKKLVWDKHIGLDIGRTKCVCCKTSEITLISFHAGHIIAESKGGKTDVSNLKPICQNCNCSMGSMDMNEFEKSFVGRKRRSWYFGRMFFR
uniref:HNH endonuclease 5 domain-containing protein n=1 Tax=viral metagenome TaxID=1070528 RepID=A0A6C0JQC5_9ZZZZ